MAAQYKKIIDCMVMDVVESSLDGGLERISMSERIMKAGLELREFLYQKVYFNSMARDELLFLPKSWPIL